MILHQVTLVLMAGSFQLMQQSCNHLIIDMEVYLHHHKLLLVLKLANKLQEVYILVMKEHCVQQTMLKIINIKELVFGHLINLLTDIKIKIIKLLAILPILHSIQQLGKQVGHLVLIHTILTVNIMLKMHHLHNLTNLWQIVLKTSDHLWQIKLNKSLTVLQLFLVHIVQLQHGILAEIYVQLLKQKLMVFVNVQYKDKHQLTANVFVVQTKLFRIMLVQHVQLDKWFKTAPVFAKFKDKHQ